MVAARRLRKSMLKDMPDINLDSIDSISNVKHKHINALGDENFIKDNLGTFDDEYKPKISIKFKYIIKIFMCVIIIFSCLLIKLFFKEKVLSNKFVEILITEYNKDYSKEDCIEKAEDIFNDIYTKSKYIIPESLAIKVKSKYISDIKPYLVNFEVKDVFNKLFSSSQKINSTDNKKESTYEDTGMGGGEPVLQTMEIPDTQISDNIYAILNKNIDIKQPVQGTITSKYGTREQIFEELSNYHTGIDIANKMGTEIYSATVGLVKSVEENNKYYGNNIEIETNGVIFKYAHLKDFNVKVGDAVTQDSIIGYMGSTGMSTGPHLHFEIKINGEAVDPNEIIKFY